MTTRSLWHSESAGSLCDAALFNGISLKQTTYLSLKLKELLRHDKEYNYI